MGLCKNLWFNSFAEQEHRIQHMFPRCYDLSVSQQAESFISDFKQTAILSIIKIMAVHFLKRNKDMQRLLEEYATIEQYESPERHFKPYFRRLCQTVDMRSSGVGNLLGISEVRDAYCFCKSFSNTLQFKEPKKARKYSRATQMRLDESTIQNMVQYQSVLVETGVPAAGFANYEQFKIVRLHHTLEKLLPQYRQIDGTHNIWIVKPSYNARGHGIYCTRQLREIVKDTDRTQQKVVQKYIERPFCIEGQKKFDFRQWVLVNSWEPLDVSVFSSAYLKVCGSTFDLKQIGDVYRHLSNYSIQKENGDKIELVMSSKQFEEFMQSSQTGHEHFSWEGEMLPKINDVVWRTLKGIQENIESKSNYFEVYGFDIVLDEELNPWVIEVNLSPACSERADWLTQMLDDSSIDLLHHIQSRILMANPVEQWSPELAALREQAQSAPHKTTKNLNPKQFYEDHELKDRWIRLDDSIQEIKDFNKVAYLNTVPQKGLQFELIADKFDIRYERKIDRGHRKEMGAIKIQRLYRGHIGRKCFLAERRHQSSIVIQKNVKCLLAKLELIRLRQKRAATVVQKQLRRILALKLAQKMEAERIFGLKTKIVTKIQTRYRMTKAKLLVQKEREQQASVRCQRHLRGYIARRVVKKDRTTRCMIVRIQKFYKKRFRLKQRSAVLLQKLIKGRCVAKRVLRLRKISQTSSKLLLRLQRLRQKLALRDWLRHSKATTIQSMYRMVILRKKYKLLLQTVAQKQLRKLCRKSVFVKNKQFAASLKMIRDRYAITVQKRMRNYLAQKKLVKMKEQDFKDRNATFIKRFMKGYLGKKEAKKRRIKIGATIMIQSLYRGFAVRQALRRERQQAQEASQIHGRRKKSMQQPQPTSEMSHYKQNIKEGRASRADFTIWSRLLVQTRQVRYMSNPQKFVAPRTKGTTNQRGGPFAHDESQRSINESQSHTSLRQSQENWNTGKFTTNQQSAAKKRKLNKKPGKGINSKDQHYELGLRHLQQQQNAGQFQSNDHTSKKGSNKDGSQHEKRQYSLTRAYKQQQYAGPPARLGSKIAQNLQKQKVANLINDGGQHKVTHQHQHLPVVPQIDIHSQGKSRQNPNTRDSFDDRLDHMIFQTMKQNNQMEISSKYKIQETVGQSKTFFDKNPKQVLAIDQEDHFQQQPYQNKHLSIETKRSEINLQSNAAIRTPVVKTQTQNSKQMSKDSSHTNLPSQRSGKNLKPLPVAQMRGSFELSSQQLTEHQLEQKVVARGLGKDNDVFAVSTSLNKSTTGGVAQTVVMRKDPSKGSLHSARESAAMKKQTQFSQHMNALQQQSQPKNTSSNLIKKTKERSKQIKTLEKLVQNSSAYMHPQAAPAMKRNTTTSMRDKITEQQKTTGGGALYPLKGDPYLNGEPLQKGKKQTRSFAKYLNTMLESQARQSTEAAEMYQPIQTAKQNSDSHYTNQSKRGAFSSTGKESVHSISTGMRQTDFKPVLVKNDQDQHNQFGSEAVIAQSATGVPTLPEVAKNRSQRQSFNEQRGEHPLSPKSNETTTKGGGSSMIITSNIEPGWSRTDAHAADNSHGFSSHNGLQSDFKQQLDRSKREINYEKRRSKGGEAKKQTYGQAMAVFNKAKDNFLSKVKHTQDRRVEAVHKSMKQNDSMASGETQQRNYNQQQEQSVGDKKKSSRATSSAKGGAKDNKMFV